MFRKGSVSKTILATLLVFIFQQTLSWAGEEVAGIASATFLKIGIGARAAGMGETSCAMSDDANAIYWNPAGLGFPKEKEISAMYNIWFEDIKHGFVGYTHPFKNCTLGGAINYLDNIGKMEETT